MFYVYRALARGIVPSKLKHWGIALAKEVTSVHFHFCQELQVNLPKISILTGTLQDEEQTFEYYLNINVQLTKFLNKKMEQLLANDREKNEEIFENLQRSLNKENPNTEIGNKEKLI